MEVIPSLLMSCTQRNKWCDQLFEHETKCYKNLIGPSDDHDVVTRKYCDTKRQTKFGNTMSGNLGMGGQKIN